MTALDSMWWRLKGRCGACGAEQAPHVVGNCTGTAGATTVRFAGLPVLRCPIAGHPARFVNPDFGSDFRTQLTGGRVPFSDERIGGRLTCCGCRETVLDSGEIWRNQASVVVLGKFSVDVELAASHSHCTSCGKEQFSGATRRMSDVFDACIAAFRSAALEP